MYLRMGCSQERSKPDVKAEVVHGGRERDIVPLWGDVEDETLASIVGESPNGDDVRFSDIEFEVCGIGNGVEGTDKGG